MAEKILLVDDELNVLLAYQRHIRNKFTVIMAESGDKGIAALKEQGPFAVVVSDYRMPGMDGIQFLSQSHKLAPDTVRIMLTGYANVDSAVNAVNEGNIFRFLTKPCTPEMFINALTAGVEQYKLVTAERELLEKTLKGSIKVLTDILSILSPVAHWQTSRLGRMAKKLAKRLHPGVIKTISLTEIMPGMVLVDDLKEDSGLVLVRKGSEVTDVLKMRILNYVRFRPVIDEIRVMVMEPGLFESP